MAKFCEKSNFSSCRDIAQYTRQKTLGHGTYGEVFQAECKITGRRVALKRMSLKGSGEGVSVRILREIRILQELKCENVVNLLDLCCNKRNEDEIFLVLEFCDHDLKSVISNMHVKFELIEQKELLRQLCEALFYIHLNCVLHRDLKPANILITNKGVLKVADFGLSRVFYTTDTGGSRYTNRVVTLWYRPPELLLGSRSYGPPIDMWSVGCIMAELWTRAPILQGESEVNQLMRISQLCGPINNEVWPDVDRMGLYQNLALPREGKRRVKERLRLFMDDTHCLDLCDKLLTLNPARRISANDALDHEFFWTDPIPSHQALARLVNRHANTLTTPYDNSAGNAAASRRAAPAHQPMNQYFDRVY